MVSNESLTFLSFLSFFLSQIRSMFLSILLFYVSFVSSFVSTFFLSRKTYYRTDPKEWTKINDNGDNGRTVDPIPFTDDNEDFTVNISPEEVESLKDEAGDIRFSKVMEFCLPRFDDTEGGQQSLWEWQAARMRNYMAYLCVYHGFKPKYYDPMGDGKKEEFKYITADHVARFYGVMMARIWSNNSSIETMWSVREILDAVPSVKEAMPQDAYKDLYRCMHFVDDWEGDADTEWEEYFMDPKVEHDGSTAAHRTKFSMVEDGWNSRWQEIVNFGKWLTMDESRVAGWYKSMMTCGPEPKPIRTGATLHTLCVTHGPLATFKLHARVYGGAKDDDLDGIHTHTTNLQKWVNLYDLILKPFKGKGRCVTMDSAYMSDIMAQIGRYEWKLNMVGTAQVNRTGADAKATVDFMKAKRKGTHTTAMWQHNTLPLVFSAWADNAIVKTLSNFHSPVIIQDGVHWRCKIDGVRQREPVGVPIPEQGKAYCETFHWIDKGNCKEAKYDLGGNS